MKNSKFQEKPVVYPFVLLPIFVWIGFVCSISFMEAWLKFQAPNVTLSIGLNIGKLVFAGLNKVEWFFAFLISVFVFYKNQKRGSSEKYFIFLLTLILILQTAFFLPILNERAELISAGKTVAQSFVHIVYIFLEILKVVFLFTFGVKVICGLTSGLTQNERDCPAKYSNHI